MQKDTVVWHLQGTKGCFRVSRCPCGFYINSRRHVTLQQTVPEVCDRCVLWAEDGSGCSEDFPGRAHVRPDSGETVAFQTEPWVLPPHLSPDSGSRAL